MASVKTRYLPEGAFVQKLRTPEGIRSAVNLKQYIQDVVADTSGSGTTFNLADGTAAAPSLFFDSDVDTGLFWVSSGIMSFSANGTAQVQFTDGAILPTTDNDIDLGSASKEFKDIYIDGIANIDETRSLIFDTDVAAAGVTLQGTTLAADGTDANINITITPKGTGGVVLPSGAVATPAVQIGTETDGFYRVGVNQLGVSINNALSAMFSANGVGTDEVRVLVDPGTANTGVTAVTNGDGRNFTTVLTVSQADAVTVADNAALSDGYLLYTFPAGAVVVNSAYMTMALTLAEDTTATPEVGLGTTIGSGANATLGAVAAAAENIITAQVAADANGTATVKTVADQVLVIEAAGDHTVYFNIADTWADTAGADLTGDIAGTVTLNWTLMS